jgi:hypothetical protein
MRPYVLDERHAKHVDTRYMTPQQRRAAVRKRRKEVRERRKADRKQLRDEYGF